MNWLQQLYTEGINLLMTNIVYLIFFSIGALCILYLFISKKNEKKAAEEAKKKAEEKKKAEHGKKEGHHDKESKHVEEEVHEHHDHGKKQTGWDAAATFLWQLFWIGVLCTAIWYLGIPEIKRQSTPDSKLAISFDPPSTKTPVRPPADTTATLHLIAGKESEPVTTQTWWYDGHMLEGTVTDIRIVHPDESESVYRNVSETNQPQGLHIAPGSKIYYTSKRGGKVFIAHF